MKIEELRTKQLSELNKLLNDSRDRLRDLRFRISQKQVKNIREIRVVKRTIAKIMMLIKDKQAPAGKSNNLKDNK